MEEIAKVLFGAAIGFIAALTADRWKQIQSSKTAAMMIVRELEFHRQRLNMVLALDQNNQAEYELKFPSPVWSAQGATLVGGAPPQEAEAILNWYASMSVLGYTLSKRIFPEGPELSGPNRGRLQAALSEAHLAAQRLAVRWSLRKSRQISSSLFDDVAP
jgi:hypothetical protein